MPVSVLRIRVWSALYGEVLRRASDDSAGPHVPGLPGLDLCERGLSGWGRGRGQATEQQVPVHRLPRALGVMWRLQQQLVHLCSTKPIIWRYFVDPTTVSILSTSCF